MKCALLLGLFTLAACGDDSGPEGMPCRTSAECLAGERCFSGFCVPGEAADADMPDAGDLDAGSDAAALDAGVDTGPEDAGFDAASSCMDISGAYGFCDGEDCPAPACYLGEVQIELVDEADCRFSVTSDSTDSGVNGTFVVSGDQVSFEGFRTTFIRMGRVQECNEGMIGTVFDTNAINFDCIDCGISLTRL